MNDLANTGTIGYTLPNVREAAQQADVVENGIPEALSSGRKMLPCVGKNVFEVV